MYQYDHYDQAMVDARVAEVRDQTKRRLEGSLSEDQFRPLRPFGTGPHLQRNELNQVVAASGST